MYPSIQSRNTLEYSEELRLDYFPLDMLINYHLVMKYWVMEMVEWLLWRSRTYPTSTCLVTTNFKLIPLYPNMKLILISCIVITRTNYYWQYHILILKSYNQRRASFIFVYFRCLQSTHYRRESYGRWFIGFLLCFFSWPRHDTFYNGTHAMGSCNNALDIWWRQWSSSLCENYWSLWEMGFATSANLVEKKFVWPSKTDIVILVDRDD